MFRLTVEGECQALSPFLQDEVYRIAREALTNAFQHACARQIEAEIRYDARAFRLRIRDDGTGIDPQVLKQGKRAGHWGLPGIRERARQIGARLDVWSEAGVGTEIQLTVPSPVAYMKSNYARRFTLFRKKRTTHAH
jgi:signal transduction histidine kinase